MTYLYFGQESGPEGDKYFADDEAGQRQYMTHEQWLTIIQMAHVKAPAAGQRVKLSIKEQIKVEVYEGGELTRTVNLSPDITEI